MFYIYFLVDQTIKILMMSQPKIFYYIRVWICIIYICICCWVIGYIAFEFVQGCVSMHATRGELFSAAMGEMDPSGSKFVKGR